MQPRSDSMRANCEIVVPHDPDAGAVRQVKNLLIQFSLAQLQAHGYFDTYTKLIAPAALKSLTVQLGPGWLPVGHALAHYDACDKLNLADEEIDRLAKSVGDRIQSTTLVSAAKRGRDEDFDVWNAVPQLHRMWTRLYQGGSVEIRKLGPKDQLIMRRGYPMNRYRYYRQAQLGTFAAAYAALGTELTLREVIDYDVQQDEVVFHVGWR